MRAAKDKEALPLVSRLRALGHRLGKAELYGSKKDLTAAKNAHSKMLDQLYWGKKGK
jgi:hypothetical protein